MANIFVTAAVIIGVLAFILFVLSIAVDFSWLSSAELYNQSDSALAVFGVIASAAAVGLWELGKDE